MAFTARPEPLGCLLPIPLDHDQGLAGVGDHLPGGHAAVQVLVGPASQRSEGQVAERRTFQTRELAGELVGTSGRQQGRLLRLDRVRRHQRLQPLDQRVPRGAPPAETGVEQHDRVPLLPAGERVQQLGLEDSACVHAQRRLLRIPPEQQPVGAILAGSAMSDEDKPQGTRIAHAPRGLGGRSEDAFPGPLAIAKEKHILDRGPTALREPQEPVLCVLPRARDVRHVDIVLDRHDHGCVVLTAAILPVSLAQVGPGIRSRRRRKHQECGS